jgi:hypothetical protein
MILLIAIIAVVVIGGIVWGARSLFSGGDQPVAETVSAGQKLLDKPSAETAVRMSVRGPITAQESHYSIAMTISQASRNLTIWRGYDGSIMTEESLANSAGSFADLTAALNRASFMEKLENVDEANAGICAVGQLIQFEILEYKTDENGKISEKSAEKLWTTSCSNLTGNFGGLSANVIDLFLDQIPDARNRIAAAKNDLASENRTTIGDPWDGLAAFK